ncbi:MAG: GNAT family N-acetyltransferase [Acidimicrobiales bacterium]
MSALEDHEIPALFDIDAAAFGQRMSVGVTQMVERALPRQRVAATRDDAELVGVAVAESSLMTVPGPSQIPTAMVVGVAVLPSHRRQGRLTSLMRHQLDDIRGRGEVIASLYASEGGIYGRYGYGQATFGTSYTMDKRAARLARPASEFGDGRVRIVSRSQAAEAFPEVFADYAPRRAGEFTRQELEFLVALGEPGGEDLGRRWYAVHEDGGSIDGYVGYEIGPVEAPGSRDKRVIVRELCTLTTAGYVALWQYLLGIDLTVELVARGRPVDEPIRWLLTDPRLLRAGRTGDRTWIRLVDVAAALARRRYPVAGDLVIEVQDAFCQWNNGLYRLVVSEDWGEVEVQVDPAKSGADISLDVSALASMYLGGVPATALAAVGRLRPSGPDVVRRATQMFANEVPPHSLTSF